MLCTGFNGVELGPKDVSLLERCPLLKITLSFHSPYSRRQARPSRDSGILLSAAKLLELKIASFFAYFPQKIT